MDIQLSDVTVHIDENIDATRRRDIEENVRSLDGVVSFHSRDDRPHLAIVEYNPAKVSSSEILAAVTAGGVHAELIGL